MLFAAAQLQFSKPHANNSLLRNGGFALQLIGSIHVIQDSSRLRVLLIMPIHRTRRWSTIGTSRWAFVSRKWLAAFFTEDIHV